MDSEDTLRLDFLIAHSAYLSFSRDHEMCNVWHHNLSGEPKPFEGYPQRTYCTPRQAIDRAMMAWEKRLHAIQDSEPKEIQRFASASNPQGFHPLKSSDFPEGSTTRAVLEMQEKEKKP